MMNDPLYLGLIAKQRSCRERRQSPPRHALASIEAPAACAVRQTRASSIANGGASRPSHHGENQMPLRVNCDETIAPASDAGIEQNQCEAITPGPVEFMS
jgi:hypothetical protein